MEFARSQARWFGNTRMLFGLVWLIDAQFKWRSPFINDFANYLSGALSNQPPLVKTRIHFWIDVLNVNPVAFAYLVAVAETALALALIFGILSNLAYLGGPMLAFVIWSTAEGFGGPYTAGSTDIGAAVIYVFVFALLFATRTGLYLGLDGWLGEKLGPLAAIVSGNARSKHLAS